jgi:carboxypeptidase C (cathepsin A)
VWVGLLAAGLTQAPVTFAAPEATETKAAAEKNTADTKSPAEHKDAPKPKVVRHEFSGTFNGESLSYTATAAETFLKNDKGEDSASIFSVTYAKKNVGAPEQRPVTFVFNGGPGSAALWLHIGVFGPKTLALPPDDSSPGAAPYRLTDNPLSILDVTDLVFIDPVGTGYSHALGTAKDEDYWGLSADASSIGSFIRTWLTANGRWNSPKYLAGESYGTARAAQVSSDLQNGSDGVYVNGIILISSILDFHLVNFQSGNDAPYICYLPTYAAAAWYHNKLDPKPDDLDAFLGEVRAFAEGEYAAALLKGSALPTAAREAIAKRLARYTGLSETYILQSDLRIQAHRFMKELLRDREQVLGRYDARILGKDADSAGEGPDGDPSYYTINGAFSAAIHDYLTRTLGFEADSRYKVLDGTPGHGWKWADKPGPGSYVNVASNLGQSMRENASLRVFTANGLYDLATPVFATELTMAHNGIPAERVTFKYFDAGHMMYTHAPSRAALARDVRSFINAGTKAGGAKPGK